MSGHWLARLEAWVQRQADRYECWLERRWPSASRRVMRPIYASRPDEIAPIWPRAAERQRRAADKVELEGLEIALRMDSAKREDTP
jgi:hypothetical protein